jgi:hypothetical protein
MTMPGRSRDKASRAAVPDGYRITAEDAKFFGMDGPKGAFKIAKRGLSKKLVSDLHQHFAAGGSVQKLAQGDEVGPSLTGDPEVDALLTRRTDALPDSAIWGRPGYQPMTEPEPASEPSMEPTRDEALRADMERRRTEIEGMRAADLAAGRPVVPASPSEEPAGEAVSGITDQFGPKRQFQKTITPEGAAREQETAKKLQLEMLQRSRRPAGVGGGASGVMGKIQAGVAEQKAAMLEQAAVAKREADTLAREMEGIELRRAEIGKAYESKRAAWQARGDELKAKVMDSEIDPKAFWARKDTGAKLTSAFALILGGIGGALTKTPNAALQVIDRAIERDLEAQRANLDKQNNLIKMHMQEGNSLEASYQLAKADLLDAANGQLRIISTKFAGEKAQAVTQEQSGQLTVKSAQLRQAVATQNQEMALRGLQMDEQRLKMALMVLKAQGAQSLTAPAVTMANVKDVKTGQVIQQPILRQVPVSDPKGVEKIKESTAGTMDALLSLGALERSWRELGPTDVANPLSMKASNYDAQKVAVIGKMRLPLTGPGILTDNEVERIMKALPSKFDWTSRGQAKLSAIKENIIAANQAVVQAYALPPGQERLGMLKAARGKLLSLTDL